MLKEKARRTVVAMEVIINKVTLLVNIVAEEIILIISVGGGRMSNAINAISWVILQSCAKNKNQQQQIEAQITSQKEEQLLVGDCFVTNNSSESWLIDSGCIQHMTYNEELFKELDKTIVSIVKIGNGELIAVRGKGTIAIESGTGTKTNTNVLYV